MMNEDKDGHGSRDQLSYFCPSKPSLDPPIEFERLSKAKGNKDRGLNPSAQAFIDHLGLPLVHPRCTQDLGTADNGDLRDDNEIKFEDDLSFLGTGVFEIPLTNDDTRNSSHTRSDTIKSFSNVGTMNYPTPRNSSISPSIPTMGPISILDLHEGSFYELFFTATTMTAPTLAMTELWLRLFAFFLAPLCLAWMIHREIRVATNNENNDCYGKKKSQGNGEKIATNEDTLGKLDKQHFRNEENGITNSISFYSRDDNQTIFVCLLGIASSAILFTDSLYVHEYGRSYGLSLFVLSSILALRAATYLQLGTDTNGDGSDFKTLKDKKIILHCSVFSLIIITMMLFVRSDGGHVIGTAIDYWLSLLSPEDSTPDRASVDRKDIHRHCIDKGIDLPTIEPGLYYSSSNRLLSTVASKWNKSSYTYDIQSGATPYLVNGDQRTGIPFLVNKVDQQEYVRVWVKNPFDGEILALDIAFPFSSSGNMSNNEQQKQESSQFIHNSDKTVYLVLHGLNGGSHEEYVRDFVLRRRSEGNTVVVLIARGMMDTFISNGWNVFHGARTGDVDIAARALRRGLDSLARAQYESESKKLAASQLKLRRPILAGVGYSMGAIVLSNYVARSGAHCALDAAMAISGGLDMRQQLNFKRSMRLWQPMLTFGLREDILIGKYARHYKERLTKEQLMQMLRATSISYLDEKAIVAYNSFDSLFHYYSEMSAMGDRYPEFQLLNSFLSNDSNYHYFPENRESWGRIANISIPFAVVHALDDPLVSWRTIGTENPQKLADSGTGNIMLLLTKGGGHVGWPLGANPKKLAWKWMNDVARDFVVAVENSKQELLNDVISS